MRTCATCNAPIRASDKYRNQPEGTKRHRNCVYPESYQPSKAAPGVHRLMMQSLSHRPIRTEEELQLVLDEIKKLLSTDEKSRKALLNLRPTTKPCNKPVPRGILF